MSDENVSVVQNVEVKLDDGVSQLSELAEAAVGESRKRGRDLRELQMSYNKWRYFESDEHMSDKFVKSIQGFKQEEGVMVSIRIAGSMPGDNPVRERDWKALCDAIRACGLRRIDRLSFNRIVLDDKSVRALVSALRRNRSSTRDPIWVSELSFRCVRVSVEAARAWARYFGAPDCKPRSLSLWGKGHLGDAPAVTLINAVCTNESFESLTIADGCATSEHVLCAVSQVVESRLRPMVSLTLYDTMPRQQRRVRSAMFCGLLRTDSMPAVINISAMFYEFNDYFHLMNAFEANTSVKSMRIAALNETDQAGRLVYDSARRELAKRRAQGDPRYNMLVMTGSSQSPTPQAPRRRRRASASPPRSMQENSLAAGKETLAGPSSPKSRAPPLLVPIRQGTLNSNISVRRMDPVEPAALKRQRKQ